MFRLQKYKKFESNSQLRLAVASLLRCCFDCKSTKNLRAIHNEDERAVENLGVVSTAKVQKIWEQFTTFRRTSRPWTWLFRLQKYKKFESNSQHADVIIANGTSCFDCKSTKNLRAIHNNKRFINAATLLFRLQKYKKFESNSQLSAMSSVFPICCFDCKSTKNLRAIHNCVCPFKLFAQLFRLQKYKKFESNSQHESFVKTDDFRCFDCKSTKNLRAIHNVTC